LLVARDVDEGPRVALEEEALQHLAAKLGVLLRAVEGHEKGSRPGGPEEAEVPDGLAAYRRILLAARELQQALRVAADEERAHDLPLELARGLGLVEGPDLVVGSHDPELPDGLAPQLGIRLPPGRGEHGALLAREHEAAQDVLLHVEVGRRSVDLAEHAAAL